jgi:hypothetical protein
MTSTAQTVRNEAQRVISTMSNDQVREAFIVAMQEGQDRVAQWMMTSMIERGMVDMEAMKQGAQRVQG